MGTYLRIISGFDVGFFCEFITFILVLREGEVLPPIKKTQHRRQQLHHVLVVHIVAEFDQMVEQPQHLMTPDMKKKVEVCVCVCGEANTPRK